jgi:hypothetical protein
VLIANSESFERDYPKLSKYLEVNKRKGLKIEIMPIYIELSRLWSKYCDKKIDIEKIREIFVHILELLEVYKPNDKISKVFAEIEEKL